MEAIVVSLISALATICTTVITAKKNSNKADKYDAKNSIIMMIMEDRMLWNEGKLPINYQNILHEYDIYHENGGNSYIHDKVEAYKVWFKQIQAESDNK